MKCLITGPLIQVARKDSLFLPGKKWITASLERKKLVLDDQWRRQSLRVINGETAQQALICTTHLWLLKKTPTKDSIFLPEKSLISTGMERWNLFYPPAGQKGKACRRFAVAVINGETAQQALIFNAHRGLLKKTPTKDSIFLPEKSLISTGMERWNLFYPPAGQKGKLTRSGCQLKSMGKNRWKYPGWNTRKGGKSRSLTNQRFHLYRFAVMNYFSGKKSVPYGWNLFRAD